MTAINRDEIYEVCLVVNGSLDMSPGKIAGQTFQVAARWMSTEFNLLTMREQNQWEFSHKTWIQEGTRTIVREAKTQAIFERVVEEVPGVVMKDEGHTEVEPDSPTVFMSYPYLHKDRPRVLDNKKVRLL